MDLSLASALEPRSIPKEYQLLEDNLLTDISWLEWGQQREALICKATIQKVSTTFSCSSRVLLGELELAPDVCTAAVEAATPSPASPTLGEGPRFDGEGIFASELV